ncbi:hypothetical protein NL676_035365 [Syzygium grande]|nr:hypothetical protein NL676_035365 [Syzygium grande]
MAALRRCSAAVGRRPLLSRTPLFAAAAGSALGIHSRPRSPSSSSSPTAANRGRPPPPPPRPSAERPAPPHLIPVPPPPAGPSPDRGRGLDFPRDAFDAISGLFADPGLAAGPALDSALDEAGVRPRNELMEAVFARFGSSPKLLFGLFRWAEKQPEFRPSAGLFNSMINALGKARDFDAAWELINGRLRGNGACAGFGGYLRDNDPTVCSSR